MTYTLGNFRELMFYSGKLHEERQLLWQYCSKRANELVNIMRERGAAEFYYHAANYRSFTETPEIEEIETTTFVGNDYKDADGTYNLIALTEAVEEYVTKQLMKLYKKEKAHERQDM